MIGVDDERANWKSRIWSAVAERSGDTAFGEPVRPPKAAWRFASRRTPKPRVHADRVDSRAVAAGDCHVARRAGDVEFHSRTRARFRGAAVVRAHARRPEPRGFGRHAHGALGGREKEFLRT